MAAFVTTVTVLAAVLCWLVMSPARIGVVAVLVFAAHPAPTLTLTAVGAAALTVVAAVVTVRSVREFGWCLVTIARPAAPLSGGAR